MNNNQATLPSTYDNVKQEENQHSYSKTQNNTCKKMVIPIESNNEKNQAEVPVALIKDSTSPSAGAAPVYTVRQVSSSNKLAFGLLYLLEGMSFGFIVGFLPLVLVNIYCLKIGKAISTYMTLCPWIIKPVYAYFLRTPGIFHLKIVWILLLFVNGFWLYYINYYSKLTNGYTEGDSAADLYTQILVFGFTVQFIIVVLDVIVDYIQVCNVRERETLAWVKTIEVALYKIGSMLGGSLLLLFTSDIRISILVQLVLYVVVGGLALFVFKLPEGDSEQEVLVLEQNQSVDSSPEQQNLVQENKEKRATSTSDISNPLKLNKLDSSNTSKWIFPPYIKALYKTKFFIIYLLTYKVCQGFLNKIFPQWMVKVGYQLQTANIICGLFPGLTSLAGTVVGGWVPAYVKKRHLQLRKENASKWRKIKNDIWFWLVVIIFVVAVLVIFVVKTVTTDVETIHVVEEIDSSNLNSNSSMPAASTNQCRVDLSNDVGQTSLEKTKNLTLSSLSFNFLKDGLGTSTNLIFILMFISLTFIGGIITTVTFTEMTAKSQDVVELKYANQYLSWLSMLEIVGKYVFSVFSGDLVEGLGYYKSYVMVTGVHLVTIFSYVGSKFEDERNFN